MNSRARRKRHWRKYGLLSVGNGLWRWRDPAQPHKAVLFREAVWHMDGQHWVMRLEHKHGQNRHEHIYYTGDFLDVCTHAADIVCK
jgi:hypothetical protein